MPAKKKMILRKKKVIRPSKFPLTPKQKIERRMGKWIRRT